jgi:hypothetical protein
VERGAPFREHPRSGPCVLLLDFGLALGLGLGLGLRRGRGLGGALLLEVLEGHLVGVLLGLLGGSPVVQTHLDLEEVAGVDVPLGAAAGVRADDRDLLLACRLVPAEAVLDDVGVLALDRLLGDPAALARLLLGHRLADRLLLSVREVAHSRERLLDLGGALEIGHSGLLSSWGVFPPGSPPGRAAPPCGGAGAARAPRRRAAAARRSRAPAAHQSRRAAQPPGATRGGRPPASAGSDGHGERTTSPPRPAGRTTTGENPGDGGTAKTRRTGHEKPQAAHQGPRPPQVYGGTMGEGGGEGGEGLSGRFLTKNMFRVSL